MPNVSLVRKIANTSNIGESSFSIAPAQSTYSVTNETELQNAITDLTSTGGVITVTNSFSISTTITIPDGVMLVGRRRLCSISIQTGGELILSDECQVRDVYFNVVKTTGIAVRMTGNKSQINNCNFTVNSVNPATCVRVQGSGNKIMFSIFTGVIGGSATGIDFFSGTNNSAIENIYE
jgi:hypothetical protein